MSRFFLTLGGAVVGGAFGGSSDRLTGAFIGGIVAFGAAECIALRAHLQALQLEVDRLGQELRRPGAPPTATATATVTATATAESIASAQTDADFARPFDSPFSASPPQPTSTDAESALVRRARMFLTGGNTVVRVGIIILFFGVAFLLRYMAEHTHVPIEWRLTGIMLGGVALLVLGWRLRRSRAGYGLALQGGGVGVLYLTVFAAFRLYGVLPAALAFPILVVVGALAAATAVLQNSIALALLGVIGGFLAPILASTGTGSHVLLFGYYAVLNAGIVAMAWFKAWRPLNLVGFVFTFGIATAWGVLQYRPEFFGSTEPFLGLFFLFYLTASLLFTVRQPANQTGYIDGTLVFGTPIAVFALQAALLHDRPLPLAYSALALSAVYLASAWWLRRRQATSHTLLTEAFLAIGVVFLTLAVPLALDARWNVAAWSLEGAALVWVGCRQRRVLARVAGVVLAVACGMLAATQFNLTLNPAMLPWANYLDLVLQSVAAIFSACMLQRYRDRLRDFEQPMAAGLFGWGLVWWLVGSVNEIAQVWPEYELVGSMIFVTLTALAATEIHRRVGLNAAKVAALLQLPVMYLGTVVAIGSVTHPATNGGWLGWPLAFLGLYGLLYRLERDSPTSIEGPCHSGATWWLCGMLGWEAAWQTDHAVVGSDAWATAAWAVIPMLVLGLLPKLVAQVAWPFVKHRDAYLHVAGVGLALFLCSWSIVANLTCRGDFAPLPYIPLFNPIDLAQAFVLLILFRYWLALRDDPTPSWLVERGVPIPVLAGLTFLWLNAILIRTLHQWFGVAYAGAALLSSTLVQTSLSIFWALLAFAAMVFATRRNERLVWLVGAALLGVVIGKLFLIDLSRVGSIERIVSFVGVGILMLVVGYFSPLPPAGRPAR